MQPPACHLRPGRKAPRRSRPSSCKPGAGIQAVPYAGRSERGGQDSLEPEFAVSCACRLLGSSCIQRGRRVTPACPPTGVAHGGKTMRLQWSKATKEGNMPNRRGEPVDLGVDQIGGATICPNCFMCRGELEVRGLARAADDCVVRKPKDVRRFHQRCRCEGVDQERWLRFDFNCYLELCRCCGVEPIRSGSRWSSFFCEECKARVLSLNRAAGGWVIPIGRHSAMHGILVRGDERFDPQVAERFAGAMRGLFAGIDHLDKWSRSVVRRNLAELGFAPGEEVGLSDYLDAARGRIDKEPAFQRLGERFASTVDR
jgi:hypothetical protein